MIKRILENRSGLTLLELMVVIAIIGLIATFFVVTTQTSYAQTLEEYTEEFVQDVKWVRNQASSYATYKFSDESDPRFPPEGYGIRVNTGLADNYEVVAYRDFDSSDYEVIKTVNFPSGSSSIDIRVDVDTPSQYNFYMVFPGGGKNLNTNMAARDDEVYSVTFGNYLGSPFCTGVCDRSRVVIGEITSAGEVLFNTSAVYYSEYVSVNNPGPPCFLAGTKIKLADGSMKSIEEIVAGDSVQGVNNSGMFDAEVIEVEERISNGYYEVITADKVVLQVTSEHPIYARTTHGTGWSAIVPEDTQKGLGFKVMQLSAGDLVRTENDWVEVESIKFVDKVVPTYNLKEVEGNIFFANGIMVHNKKNPSQQNCPQGACGLLP